MNLISKWAWVLMLGGVFFLSSCDKDDDIIIDPGTGGINVSNGLYITSAGVDPVGSALLSPESVEADGFTSQSRNGFVGGYVYLAAGDYQVVQVTDKEITATFGGTLSTESDMASACDYNEYHVVATLANGPAFNVAKAGLYKVTHDQIRSELILYEIVEAGLIGDATPNGWSGDTKLAGTVDAAGGEWKAEGVILRAGQWKVRFNCRWNLDRRDDPNGGFGEANGYQLFTNFGGSADDLKNGNDAPNIAQTEDGIYTVTLNWTPRDGFVLDLERTGDAPEITFDPNDYKMGVIGSATAKGWDEDRNMLYKKEGTVYGWYGVYHLVAGGEIKFRANDLWDFNLGGTLTADGTVSTLEVGGGNIASPGEGDYYIALETADEGKTWTAKMTEMGWSVIGAGSPSGAWDVDTDLTSEGFDMDGVTTYSLTADFTTGEWKFRAGHDWKLNLGQNLSPLIQDGSNLSFAEAGTYKITMTFNGADYVATAEKQ